jgi:hypothetical protein
MRGPIFIVWANLTPFSLQGGMMSGEQARGDPYNTLSEETCCAPAPPSAPLRTAVSPAAVRGCDLKLTGLTQNLGQV